MRQSSRRAQIYCTVNPFAGREGSLARGAEVPAEESRSVLVVGGGPGGMQAAATAAARGHDVALWERADELGGALRFAAQLPARSRWGDLVEDLGAALAEGGVDVELGREATVDDLAAHGAEVTVLATGATFDKSGFSILVPGMQSIPGLDVAHLLDPVEAITDPDSVGQSVLIFDDTGGPLPMSLAIMLAEAGRRVELVTPQLHAGAQLLETLELPWTYPRAVAAGVQLSGQSFVAGLDGGEATVASIWGNDEPRAVAADTVILSLLRVSNSSLYEAAGAQGLETVRIGDCLAPREVDDAIEEGTRIVLDPTMAASAFLA